MAAHARFWKRVLISSSAAETRRLAASLARGLSGGTCLLLFGPLGSGKTTFVQGLARGLRARTLPTSPTFKLVNLYRGRLPLIHLDLYRVRRSRAADFEMVREFLEEGSLVAIEWAERISHWGSFPKEVRVRMGFLGRKRRIEVLGLDGSF